MSPGLRFDFRLAAAVLLLAAAAASTWMTIDGLSARRRLRTELAEISHARYDLLNADRWVAKITPILDANIDALDFKAAGQANLRPMVRDALYRLLDSVKEQMSAKKPPAPGASGGAGGTGGAGGASGLLAGNPLIANMMAGALRPHIPEYADIVLQELGRPEAKDAVKKYLKSVLADGAKNTFSAVDMRWYSSILEEHGCTDLTGCQRELGGLIRQADAAITWQYLTVLSAAAAGFLLLMVRRPQLRPSSGVVLLLFCVTLLVGGVLTPMLEVEARISHLRLTFLGEPIAFADQVLYFQSKSVLEVFHALITTGRIDMWVVGVLVLMFSIVFPILKILTSTVCLYQPQLLHRSRLARFFVLESAKWSMADVMALAIFMAFVAFNGLIPNTLAGLRDAGVDLAIPTDSSKILPGYQLFIGFCIASLFLSKRLSRGILRKSAEISPAV